MPDYFSIKSAIESYANQDKAYGWKRYAKTLINGKTVSITVPYRAFVCLALSRAGMQQSSLMPEYIPFSEQGLKMVMDNPYHSDAWIGAGLSIEKAYDVKDPCHQLFMAALHEEQKNLTCFDFSILSKGDLDLYTGTVTHDENCCNGNSILVVENADIVLSYQAFSCTAIICENGSKAAHLAVVGREAGIGVIRLEQALIKYPPGCTLTIDMREGKVKAGF